VSAPIRSIMKMIRAPSINALIVFDFLPLPAKLDLANKRVGQA